MGYHETCFDEVSYISIAPRVIWRFLEHVIDVIVSTRGYN